jgi:hypothetical protein
MHLERCLACEAVVIRERSSHAARSRQALHGAQFGPRLGCSGYTEPDGGPSSEVNLLIPDRA